MMAEALQLVFYLSLFVIAAVPLLVGKVIHFTLLLELIDRFTCQVMGPTGLASEVGSGSGSCFSGSTHLPCILPVLLNHYSCEC